ncbi:PREDICTED: uncharacterized protein LOC109193144 isoform X2 [Ipomoea nil]|uniref:uncharacterized protein LOC109193144 isoform X2 n=1 Tax=Ipomoea nil TaxID=35883 RepID=UPI0009018868|nr:PREDICTED: uncharacterized protein LOC109193144 isoform X2 [Ipomoea nil]
MSTPAELPSEHCEEEQESLPSTHHPSAPSHELFDISTTVDPSYVISLIRKLLPTEVKDEGISGGQETEELKTASVSASENGEGMWANNENEAADMDDNFDKVDKFQGLDVRLCCESTKKGSSAGEESWEEYGCILWDLAASKTHAEFMVQNLILEVLFSTLVVSKSARITEISLGIIGNLACHELSRKKITSTNGLIGAVMEQLFLDDTPCLCEACRVVTLCLQGDKSVLWAEALQSENILCRILWIMENTLNPNLLEKSVGLLLATLQSKQEVAVILQPPLMKLGLPCLMVDLLSFEMGKLREERLPERYSVLDLILQTFEALSVIDESSQEICASKRLFLLLTDLIKLPEKVEVADSCVTAAVLLANILTDAADLALEIFQDLLLLQGLFSLFPFASADAEARSALWSIIARLLIQVQEIELSPLQLHQYVSVITSETEVIEEELLDHQSNDSNEECGSSATLAKFAARNVALNGIVRILSQWMDLEDRVKESLRTGEYHVNKGDAYKLLHCCGKYIKSDASVNNH